MVHFHARFMMWSIFGGGQGGVFHHTDPARIGSPTPQHFAPFFIGAFCLAFEHKCVEGTAIVAMAMASFPTATATVTALAMGTATATAMVTATATTMVTATAMGTTMAAMATALATGIRCECFVAHLVHVCLPVSSLCFVDFQNQSNHTTFFCECLVPCECGDNLGR